MKSIYLLMFVVCLVVQHSAGKKYCTNDDDCQDLGDLFCIKSQCDIGVCGCPRDRAAVFLGHRYSCVPLRRVGEACSTDGAGGLCGAATALCQEGKCTCPTAQVSKMGGQRCEIPTRRFAGETCSTDGQCEGGLLCRSPESGASWYEAVRFNVPTCACPNNRKLVITNAFSDPFDNDEINNFVGSSFPTCIEKKIGDSCMQNTDCDEITGAECSNGNVCICSNATHEPNYEKDACRTPLGIDVPCDGVISLGQHCDGSKGLVCGNACLGADEDNSVDNANAKCTCGPHHTWSGNVCELRDVGSSCFGDYNCKGFSPNGICVDGRCENDGLRLKSSMGLLILLLFTAFHLQ